MKKLIYDSYCEAVALSKAPNELKRALKTHERTPVFINNLEKELKKVDPRILNTITIKNTVYDLTNLYIHNVMRLANEKQMSALDKFQMQQKQSKLKKFKDDADKMMRTGIITEDMLED